MSFLQRAFTFPGTTPPPAGSPANPLPAAPTAAPTPAAPIPAPPAPVAAPPVPSPPTAPPPPQPFTAVQQLAPGQQAAQSGITGTVLGRSAVAGQTARKSATVLGG
jgi:hypothetical protein